MNCNEIRDIIITDYVDNEMSAKTRGEMELHLSICDGCHSFKEAVMSGVVASLRSAEAANPPEALWFKVKNRIERSVQEENSFDIGAVISSLWPKWANVAVLASMVITTSIAGNYLAHNIWSKFAQQSASVTGEESDTLALAYLNDIPGEQAQKVYNNITGG
jgi:anti-sigma factor RsiW